MEYMEAGSLKGELTLDAHLFLKVCVYLSCCFSPTDVLQNRAILLDSDELLGLVTDVCKVK
jgi:hypothetical protein